MKKILIALTVAILVGLGTYYLKFNNELNNQMYGVSIPQSGIDENIKIEIMKRDLQNLENPNSDDQIKIILAKFQEQGEKFYYENSTSYKGFCTSPSSNAAGALSKNLAKNSVYTCNDSRNQWSASVKLSTNDYWCADFTNNFKSIQEVQKETFCSPIIYLQ